MQSPHRSAAAGCVPPALSALRPARGGAPRPLRPHAGRDTPGTRCRHSHRRQRPPRPAEATATVPA
eukprot:scaffold5539_cov126-Isochrysis_galbana.AAC.4